MRGEGPSNNTPREGGHGAGHFFARTPHHLTGLPSNDVVNAPPPSPPLPTQPPSPPPMTQGH